MSQTDQDTSGPHHVRQAIAAASSHAGKLPGLGLSGRAAEAAARKLIENWCAASQADSTFGVKNMLSDLDELAQYVSELRALVGEVASGEASVASVEVRIGVDEDEQQSRWQNGTLQGGGANRTAFTIQTFVEVPADVDQLGQEAVGGHVKRCIEAGRARYRILVGAAS